MSEGIPLSPWGEFPSEHSHSQTSPQSNFTPREEEETMHFSYHSLSLAAPSPAAFWPFSTADGFVQIWPVIFGHSKYHLAFWVISRLPKLTCFFENLPRPGRQIFLSDWSANQKRLWFPELVTLKGCSSVKSSLSPTWGAVISGASPWSILSNAVWVGKGMAMLFLKFCSYFR